jgi:hypothetical protein
MSNPSARPTEAQIEAFVNKMRAYRDTLPEDEQRLLNSMFFAAMGQHAEKDEDTHAYWVSYAAPYAYSGWYGSPWGYSYGYYYPTYW